MPGDSPLGLRLPLASLPHVPPEDYPHRRDPQDPMEPRDAAVEDKDARSGPACRRRPAERAPSQQAPKPVRTALAVEPRDGVSACSCRRSSGSRTISN